MKKVGEKAPLNVKVINLDGADFSLQSVLGNWVVVYFYPKDDTPGCTTEACSIRDLHQELKDLGVMVYGVSKDSVKSHLKFKDKYKLNFELLSDEDHKLMEGFGVWGERKFMGRTYMGTSRSTFLINPEGVIVEVWEKVTPANHGEEIVDRVKELIK